MKLSKLYKLIFIVSFFWLACKKEQTEKNDITTLSQKLALLSSNLKKEPIVNNLYEKINDSLIVAYEPLWEKATTKISRDSLSFSYIPLTAKMLNNGTEHPAKLANFQAYLIIKNDEQYYIGKYYREQVSKSMKRQADGIKDFEDFTGIALLRDLSDNKSYKFEYENGSLKPKNKTNAGARGWVEVCHMETTCSFYGVCENTFYFWQNVRGCDYPTSPVGGYCDWAAWNLGSTFPVQICESVYVPDPPLPDPSPGTGGGTPGTPGGGGSSANEITYNGIKDPCLNRAVKDAVESGKNIKGIMADIIRNFDGNKNINIAIIDRINPDGRPGNTGPSRYDPNTKQFSTTIALMEGYFDNTTYEAVGTTLIHEFIHAYITYTQSTILNNHNSLVQYYLDPMANYLQSAYGLTLEDAYSLVWSGVQDSPSWANKNMDDLIPLGRSGISITKEDLSYRYLKYKDYNAYHAGTTICK